MDLPVQSSSVNQSSLRNYRFGKGMEANAFLIRGWGEPELGFVWTEGKSSLIILPAFSGSTTLILTAWGYVLGAGDPQEALVFVNGSLCGFFEVSEKSMFRVTHGNIGDGKDLEITLYIPTAISPKKREGTNDARQLGIGLAAIQQV